MNEVYVKWDISQYSGTHKFTLKELGVHSKSQWDSLSSRQQEERLQIALDNLPKKVELVVDSWG